jgi:hypothetical protein
MTLFNEGLIDKNILSTSSVLILCNEIIRIRNRLSKINFEGKSQIMKSLERIEDELQKQGFEVINFLGGNYDEGYSFRVHFIKSSLLTKEEKIITKVIKPQINYKGQLIQMAEVEVSEGTKEK